MGNSIFTALGRTNRLGRKLVLYMVLSSAILSVLATGLQLLASYSRDRNTVLQTFEIFDTSFRPSLEKAVWEFNFSQVGAILDGIAAKINVHSLTLETATGQTWVRGVQPSAEGMLTRSFVLAHEGPDGPREQVGELHLALSMEHVHARLWEQFQTLFLSNLVKTTIASLVMLGLFHVFVARHLDHIARYVAQTDWLRMGAPLALRRRSTNKPDDLNNVENAINEARSIVLNSVDDLNREIGVRMQAEQEANSANEAKSAFLATMSHEIRTPINAVMGLLELIERGDIPERQRKQAIAARTSAEALLSQLTNVLEISRLNAKAIKLAREDLPIGEFADAVHGQLEGAIAFWNKPITPKLILDVTPDTIVRIDKRRALQVVSNLVDNATRFTEAGSISITISLGSESDPSDLCIAVKDTGVGIAPDELTRIFERFTQIDGSLTRPKGGTGLGLAISHDLTELMGGSLSVNSCVGQGSTFILQLPVEQRGGVDELVCVGG